MQLNRGADTVVLPARNISLGGLLIDADGKLKGFSVGDVVEVQLFDMSEDGESAVRADASVIRNDGKGLALSWASTDPVTARKLADLLQRLNPT